MGPVPRVACGQERHLYDEEFSPSTACVQAGDSTQVYKWTYEREPGVADLSQGQTSAMGAAVALFGTAPTVAVPTTYTFTLMFQANQSAVTPNDGNNSSSVAINYTLTISP